jgi:hypothetical protein
MVGGGKGVAVLSDPEQRVWNDVERFWEENAPEPPAAGRSADIPRTLRPRKLDDAPLRLILSCWAAIFLGFFGAHAVGLALAAGAALGLAMWRYWPLLSASQSAASGPLCGQSPTTDQAARWPAEKPWHRRLPRWITEG